MAKDEIVDYFWYGDWAGTVDGCMGPEDPRSAITPETIIATGFYYYNYITLAKMAEILGNDTEVKENLRGAEKVKKAFANTKVLVAIEVLISIILCLLFDDEETTTAIFIIAFFFVTLTIAAAEFKWLFDKFGNK
jgi:L-asparagine transporter-like permease